MASQYEIIDQRIRIVPLKVDKYLLQYLKFTPEIFVWVCYWIINVVKCESLTLYSIWFVKLCFYDRVLTRNPMHYAIL